MSFVPKDPRLSQREVSKEPHQQTSRKVEPPSRSGGITTRGQDDQQLQSRFFALLPSELRIQILSLLIYEGSPSQHIVHYHEAGGLHDGFVRVPCTPQPDSLWRFRHVSEQRNLYRSPWRDGHWRCADRLARHVHHRRARHRREAAAAAVVGALWNPTATETTKTTIHPPLSRPPNQSLPLSSQTWSFSGSPLSTVNTNTAANDHLQIQESINSLASALSRAHHNKGTQDSSPSPLVSPIPLLLTCRRLHNETADILYESVTFIGLKPLRRFLRQVTSADYLNRIRHITLQWDAIVRTSPLLAHDFDDWEPTCQKLARLEGLATLNVKVFVCQRTPARTKELLLTPVVDLVGGGIARISTHVVKDCGDPHVDSEFVLVRIGDSDLPVRVCRAGSVPH